MKFQKISTGNGYQNDLIATTNNRLEIVAESIENLNTTIRDANKRNDKLQGWFLTLSIIGTVLTATQLVQVIDILVKGIGK